MWWPKCCGAKSFSTVHNQMALSQPDGRFHSRFGLVLRSAEIAWQRSSALSDLATITNHVPPLFDSLVVRIVPSVLQTSSLTYAELVRRVTDEEKGK